MPKDRDRDDRGRVKVRVIEFDVEGTNESIIESLRAMAGAITTKPTAPRAALPPKLPQRSDGSRGAPSKEAETAEGAEPLDEAEEAEEAEPAREEKDVTPKRQNGQRKAPKLKILPLDLNGEVPWESFANSHRNDDNGDKYLLVSFWLKKHGLVEEVKRDHIYTLFTAVEWPIPADLKTTFRQLEAKGWVDRGKSPASWSINHIGENQIVKMRKAPA